MIVYRILTCLKVFLIAEIRDIIIIDIFRLFIALGFDELITYGEDNFLSQF